MCCVEHRGLSSLWHSIALQRKNTEICGATSRAFVHSRYLKEIIYKDYLCSSQNRAGFGGSCNNTGVKHKNCYDRAACWLASSNFWGHQKKLTAWNLPAQIDASRALCIAINFLSRRLKIIKRGGGGEPIMNPNKRQPCATSWVCPSPHYPKKPLHFVKNVVK